MGGDSLLESVKMLVATIAELQDKLEHLEGLCNEAAEFIQHDANCGVHHGRFNNCGCGYDKLWSKLNER